MNKEDLVRKLTSRKFWAAIAGFVTGLVVFLKNPTTDAQAITALIMSMGTLIAYIVGEGLIDAAREGGEAYIVEPEEHPPEEQ